MLTHDAAYRILKENMILLFALATLLQTSTAHAALYFEPGVFVGSGKSDFIGTVGSSTINATALSIGYGATARVGAASSDGDMFSALEVGYGQAPISGATGSYITFGLTIGITLKYSPIRIILGYDFSDGYSDANVSLGGNTLRAGLGLYLSESFLVNLDFARHLYTGVEAASGVSASLPTSVSYNALQLSVSLPISISASNTPWRTRYRNKAFSIAPAATEAPPAAPISGEDLQNAPPEEMPPAPPLDETPPAPPLEEQPPENPQ